MFNFNRKQNLHTSKKSERKRKNINEISGK